jgi:hypothetical protein
MPPILPKPLRAAILAAGVAGAALGALPAAANTQSPQWSPQASERLVKLPTTYLEQALKQDFQGSELASALGSVESRLQAKVQSLAELKQAVQQTRDPELRTELEHQLLVEKKDYVTLLGQRADLERQQIETRKRIYRQLHAKAADGGPKTAIEAELAEKQQAAYERFRKVQDQVDMRMFGQVAAERSKYAKEYEKTQQAIDKLAAAIEQHPMSRAATIDGREVSKKEYLQALISQAETDLALLDQQEQLFGYMAKLVALDAMALSTGLGRDVAGAGGGEGGNRVDAAANIDLFIQ